MGTVTVKRHFCDRCGLERKAREIRRFRIQLPKVAYQPDATFDLCGECETAFLDKVATLLPTVDLGDLRRLVSA